MSTLNVDNINEYTTGNGVEIPGHILQVKSQFFDTQTSISGSSFADTGLTLAITPSATSSKILIVTHLNGVQAVDWFYGSIGRSISGGASTSNLCSGQYGFGVAYSINNTMVTMSFLDSPNTTSAVTYYPTFRDDNGANNVKINMENTQCSSITLSEVLA